MERRAGCGANLFLGKDKELNTSLNEGSAPALSPADLVGRLPASAVDAYECTVASLEDSKAENIVTIDISEKSSLGDAMIVASGRSHRHVGAIADRLMRDLKTKGYGTPSIEGLPHCDWVLIDTGDLIIHIFRPEVREFYSLEKMWSAEVGGEKVVVHA